MHPCPYTYIKEKLHNIPEILTSNDSDRFKANWFISSILIAETNHNEKYPEF